MIDKSDEQLVSEVQKRNPDSLDTLIKRHLPKAKDIIHNVFKNLEHQDFQDALQASLIKIWNKIPEFRGDCAFYTWFLHILKNETYTVVRKRIVRRKYETSSDQIKEDQEIEEDFVSYITLEDLMWENPENALEKRENAAILRKMLDKTMLRLSSNHLKILKMFLEDEKSYKEISDKLNLPIGTIMSRVFYARKYMQKLILDYSRKNNVDLMLTNSKT